MITRRAMFQASLVATAIPVAAAVAKDDYPSVAVLQNELNAHPGDQLPKLVPWKGRMLQPVFQHAEQHGGGFYTITIRLV